MRIDQRDRAKPPADLADSPLAHALAYAKLGWHVFPVHWIKDGRCSCAESCDSPGKHPIRQVTPTGFKEATTDVSTLVRWWAQYPQANVAVRTGPESGIWVLDVDCAGDKQGDVALDQLVDTHGKLPDTAVAHTGSGGIHYFFSYPTDGSRIGNRTNAPARSIDVRGDGGYVVVSPSTHISGGTYEWEASSDPIEGQAIAAAQGWLTQAVTETKAQASTVAVGTAMLTREQVLELKSALGYLDFEDYHSWIQVGQALHASGAGQQAYGIWCDWSRQSEKFNPELQAKKWRSFGGDRGLNLESIFAWAQDVGWVNPASNEYRSWLDRNEEEIKKANRRVEYRTVERKCVTERRLPVAQLDQVDHWMRQQLQIQPAHACTQATLSFACAMAARRYVSSDDDPAHTYLGIVSQSIGAIRDIKSLLHTLFAETGQRPRIRGTKLSTSHLLYKTLLREPATYWISDDYGQMVRFAKRQPSCVIEGVLSVLAECHASPALYLDKDVDPIALKSYDDCTIYDPALTMLGLISDDQLGALTKRSEIGRGALEQMLCVQAGGYEVNADIHSRLPVPDPVKATVTALRSSDSTGNLADVFPGTLPSSPRVVTFPSEVKLCLSGFNRELIELVSNQRNLTPLALGAQRTMRRLLVALAAWQSPLKPYADRALAEWVGQYVKDHLEAFIERVQVVGSDDGKLDTYQKVLESINEAGPEGISKRMLVQRCWAFRTMPSAKRSELIDTMLDDEVIVDRPTPSGRGKVLVDRRFLEEANK